LYRPTNYQYENVIDGVAGLTGAAGSDPWGIPGGTNAVGTNEIVNVAIRPGVDKITFKLGQFDSLIGNFITTTNIYTDHYVSNSVLLSQTVERVLTTPDILFVAEDLGIDNGLPIWFNRSETTDWQNNDALNGSGAANGPGVITPPVVFRYSNLGPYFVNTPGTFLDEYGATQGSAWADFDGSTNAPIVFPDGYSVQWLEYQVLFGGAGGGGSPWVIADSLNVITNGQDTAGGTTGN
jgi:hypothetical protein